MENMLRLRDADHMERTISESFQDFQDCNDCPVVHTFDLFQHKQNTCEKKHFMQILNAYK